MIDSESLIAETTAKIFADHCSLDVLNGAERGEFPQALWNALTESGLPLAWNSEDQGGFGAEDAEVFGAIAASAAAPAPVPLAETLIANRLLEAAGMAPVHEAATFALLEPTGNTHVAFGDRAEHLILFDHQHGRVSRFPTRNLDLIAEPALSPDGNHKVMFPAALAEDDGDTDWTRQAAEALVLTVRAVQMAAAMEAALDLSLTYVSDREQFGRPLSKFQAIQHQLAVAGSECAAASMAATLAADAFARDPLNALGDAMVAKVAIGQAIEPVTQAFHQVHGAMGYTQEYRLHHYTRRLWAWRDALGNEEYWAARLGARVAASDTDTLWNSVTGPIALAS